MSKFSTRILILAAMFAAILLLGPVTPFASGQTPDDPVALTREWTLGAVTRASVIWRSRARDFEGAGQFTKADQCYIEAAIVAQTYNDYAGAFLLLKKPLSRRNRNTAEWTTASAIYSLYSLDRGDKNTADQYSKAAIGKVFDDRSRAYALFSRGSYLYYYGKMAEAMRFFEDAETAAARTDDVLLKTMTAVYVAYSLIRVGRPYDAAERLNRISAQAEASGHKKAKVQAYIALAFVSYHLNERQKAMTFLNKSESLLPTDFELMDRARVSTTMGIIHSDLGDYRSAETYFQRAIAGYEQLDYRAGMATTLTFLGEALALAGDLVQARAVYEKALRISRSINDLFRVASVFEGLGVLEYRAGNHQMAATRYLSALGTYREIGVRIPMAETLLGNAYRESGKLDLARKWYEKSVSRCRETRDFQQLGDALYQLSLLAEKENKPDESLAAAEESVAFTEQLYQNVANSGLRRTFVSTIFDRYELLISLIMKNSRQSGDESEVKRAFLIAEKSRARSILEGLNNAEAETFGGSSETLIREKQILALLASRAETLTESLSERAGSPETSELKREISELENQLEAVRTELKLANPEYAAVSKVFDFDVANFQREVLDENTILLEFFFGTRQSYLWVLRNDGLEAFDLPPKTEIESDIAAIRNIINENYGREDENVTDFQTRVKTAEKNFKVSTASLGRKLFGSVDRKFSRERLLVVSDSTFSFIPISALNFPGTDDDAVLLDKHEIIQVPSARVIAALAKNSGNRENRAGRMLFLSDPVFSRSDERLGGTENSPTDPSRLRSFTDWNNLPRLLGSASEVQSIMKQVRSDSSLNLSGFGANRANFLSLPLEAFTTIHFATHGGVDENNPALSGIVLSRFNPNGEQIDAVVRVQDVYSMRLAADLVVLSACETGIGKNVRGEGLMSLNNAFLQSGAKTVVSSLWKVEDGATLELMNHFYASMITDGSTPAAALRKAQLKLRENPRYSSPFYWAAFQVSGDFKNVPQISRSFGSWYYFLAAGLVLIVSLFIIRRHFYSTRKA